MNKFRGKINYMKYLTVSNSRLRINRILVVALSILLFAQTGVSQNEYAKIESKAQRFFDNQEWASANAMYMLMLDQKPEKASTYARAVVAEMMVGDTVAALDMVPRSMEYKIPFDSLLNEIRNVSFSIGNGDLYEDYLLKLKVRYDWLNRVADNYLMRYYSFRQNGPQLIAYAEMMLSGLPENINFMRMLAKGQLLDGKTQSAIETWNRIMTLYPDNYDTMLDLANCYEALGDKAEALKWWRKVADVDMTPYVESRIKLLSDAEKK